MRHKAAVTFVTRNKSNQKYFWSYTHSATADGLNSARLIGTQMCIPITVTAIKINQILQALSAAYGHSLGYISEAGVLSACSVQSNSIFVFEHGD